MTTANEAHDAQLAAIKVRFEEVRGQLNDPGARIGQQVEVGAAAPTIGQLRLREVYADELGRIWVQSDRGRAFVMIVDPRPRECDLSPETIATWSLKRLESDETDTQVMQTDREDYFQSVSGVSPEMRGVPDPDDTQDAQGFKAHG